MSELLQRAQRRPVVLHLEDDPVLARALSVLLRVEGYEVIGATSRGEALDCLERQRIRPDLILCAYELADGSRGHEVVTEVTRRISARIPALMLAGDRPNENLYEALTAVERVFQKPLEVDQLLQVMAALTAAVTSGAFVMRDRWRYETDGPQVGQESVGRCESHDQRFALRHLGGAPE